MEIIERRRSLEHAMNLSEKVETGGIKTSTSDLVDQDNGATKVASWTVNAAK
jgi:hypothetical protein